MLSQMFKRKDNSQPNKKLKIDPGFKPINTLNSKPTHPQAPEIHVEFDTPSKDIVPLPEPDNHAMPIKEITQEIIEKADAPSIVSSLQTQTSDAIASTIEYAPKEVKENTYTEPPEATNPEPKSTQPTPLFKKVKPGKESHNFIKLDLINGYREKGKIKKKSKKIQELEKQRMLNKVDKKYGGNGSYGVEGFAIPEQEEKMPSFTYGYALDPLLEKQSIVGNDTMEEFLCHQFGFKEFKNGQKEAIAHLINKKSTLVILPTGAGKSLIFQFYALWTNTTIIVITPLLSLMSDQVE